MTFDEFESLGMQCGVPWTLLKLCWPGPWAPAPFNEETQIRLRHVFAVMMDEIAKHPPNVRAALDKIDGMELKPGDFRTLEEMGRRWSEDWAERRRKGAV